MSLHPLPLPRDAVLPDYGSGGLLGLARALRHWLAGGEGGGLLFGDGEPTPTVVLVVIDGLGDALLRDLAPERHSSLRAHRALRLSSVFPSTTASAVTTLLTGLAPAEHGLNGWHIHDRRFGGVIAPLPLLRRGGGGLRAPFLLPRLFPYRSMFARAQRPATMVSPAEIAFSPFSRRHARGARMVGYRGLGGLEEAIEREVRLLGDAGGLVHAYYTRFDGLCHAHGCRSAQAQASLAAVDDFFGRLIDRLRGRNVTVLLTADHGFIDAPDERRIRLERHAPLAGMLAAPLFGERRAAFCMVRKGADAEFAAYVREHLAGRAVCATAAQVLGAGLLGPGRPHRRLVERLGSHLLLPEPGWTITDRVAGETLPTMTGVHGGLSADEMWVPLVRARC